jgi:hypothetical protein
LTQNCASIRMVLEEASETANRIVYKKTTIKNYTAAI